MNKRMLPGLVLVLLIVLSGCNTFTTNLYSGIDNFKNPDLTNADDLLDAADEPQFYENLKNDPAAKAQVLETLQSVLDDPDASDEKKQEAALMMTDVHLKTTNTEDTMSNLNSLVGDAVSGEDVFEGSGDGPETFFRAIFGEPPAAISFADYKAAVTIQLNGFLAAAEPLQHYGETLEVTGTSPPGTNDGDNATKALMAGMTRTLVYYIDASTEAARVDILASYLATPKNPDGSIPYTITYREGEGGIPDFNGPSDMLVDPADPTNPDKDGLVEVVAFGGLDLDSLF
ncbi:hypothetical protein [Oceanispirochaeta sp. M2]|uniref:hypothetical protein n=1 Tax=Oceanispirochaeta sp. M2 TaxID=2735869 RepID=UPI001556ACBE|nr:hypothetical protein [Oceanispirochaeta sp. M2]MBF9015691.1 hypothetical protein [Oceanispirochaeta sp. M2]